MFNDVWEGNKNSKTDTLGWSNSAREVPSLHAGRGFCRGIDKSKLYLWYTSSRGNHLNFNFISFFFSRFILILGESIDIHLFRLLIFKDNSGRIDMVLYITLLLFFFNQFIIWLKKKPNTLYYFKISKYGFRQHSDRLYRLFIHVRHQ